MVVFKSKSLVFQRNLYKLNNKWSMTPLYEVDELKRYKRKFVEREKNASCYNLSRKQNNFFGKTVENM